MQQGKTSTKSAGVDVDKRRLNAAVHGEADQACFANDAEGFAQLGGWLRQRGVGRVGLEATGGYERGAVSFLQAGGFEVVLTCRLKCACSRASSASAPRTTASTPA
jgi:transposase